MLCRFELLVQLAHVRRLLSINASACAIRSQSSLVVRRMTSQLDGLRRIAIAVTPFAFPVFDRRRTDASRSAFA